MRKFTQQQIVIILSVIIIVAAVIIGIVLGTAQLGSSPSSLLVAPGACRYNGQEYKNKESFKSSDDCNTCICGEGRVVCTVRACAEDLPLPLAN